MRGAAPKDGPRRRVWVAELDCAGCEIDGAVRRLQVNLNLADRVLSVASLVGNGGVNPQAAFMVSPQLVR